MNDQFPNAVEDGEYLMRVDPMSLISSDERYIQS